MDEQYLKNLPKVEVSFQDDFAGSNRELYLTPAYVLRMLKEQGVEATIGQKILFWEKDEGADGKQDYICNVGEIVEASADALKEYEGYGHAVQHKDLVSLSGRPVVVHIERNSYFRSELNSPIFQTV